MRSLRTTVGACIIGSAVFTLAACSGADGGSKGANEGEHALKQMFQENFTSCPEGFLAGATATAHSYDTSVTFLMLADVNFTVQEQELSTAHTLEGYEFIGHITYDKLFSYRTITEVTNPRSGRTTPRINAWAKPSDFLMANANETQKVIKRNGKWDFSKAMRSSILDLGKFEQVPCEMPEEVANKYK